MKLVSSSVFATAALVGGSCLSSFFLSRDTTALAGFFQRSSEVTATRGLGDKGKVENGGPPRLAVDLASAARAPKATGLTQAAATEERRGSLKTAQQSARIYSCVDFYVSFFSPAPSFRRRVLSCKQDPAHLDRLRGAPAPSVASCYHDNRGRGRSEFQGVLIDDNESNRRVFTLGESPRAVGHVAKTQIAYRSQRRKRFDRWGLFNPERLAG